MFYAENSQKSPFSGLIFNVSQDLLTFCVLSLEQEKQTSSRRKTIAGGEETNRGNKRGHKPEQKQKRVWKLSQSDNIPKDKLILKFKHRKKD